MCGVSAGSHRWTHLKKFVGLLFLYSLMEVSTLYLLIMWPAVLLRSSVSQRSVEFTPSNVAAIACGVQVVQLPQCFYRIAGFIMFLQKIFVYWRANVLCYVCKLLVNGNPRGIQYFTCWSEHMKYSDKPLPKETVRKLQLLPEIEPIRRSSWVLQIDSATEREAHITSIDDPGIYAL